MSRVPRDYIWYQWFANADCFTCPVCCKNSMNRDDSASWHREHILRLSLGGTDTYPNLIPICRSCNLAMGKRCRSTYQYLAKLGRITPEQAMNLERLQMAKCGSFDPVCEQTQKNGARCSNLRGGMNECYCWKHILAQQEAMECSE
jgi:hypothetical protein